MEIPRHWRLKKQRYALVGEVCPHCDARIFPPRDVCPECGNDGTGPECPTCAGRPKPGESGATMNRPCDACLSGVVEAGGGHYPLAWCEKCNGTGVAVAAELIDDDTDDDETAHPEDPDAERDRSIADRMGAL